MNVYKSKFGVINEESLMLYKPKHETISLNSILEVKIIKKKHDLNYFLNLIKNKDYDFIVVLDNQEQIEFSFGKKNLGNAVAFKNRILHMKFSIQESIMN